MSDRRPRIIYAAKKGSRIIYAAKKGSRIIYIGQTTDMRRRVSNHKSTSPWCLDGVYFVELDRIWGSDEADEAERSLIAQHAPEGNIRYSPARSTTPQVETTAGLCSVVEAAEITGRSTSYINVKIRNGHLTLAGKAGKARMLLMAEVEKLATQTRAAA